MLLRQTLVLLALAAGVSPCVIQAQSPPPAPTLATSTPASTSTPVVHRQVLPIPPAQLLALLPKTPDKWQLKQSQASNFVVDWASARANREFVYTPPASNPADAPPPPLNLRVSITDTGYYQGLMSDFEGLPGPKSPVEALVLNGFPARQVTLGKTGARLRVLVNGRYVVQIEVQNQPVSSAQQWLRLVEVSKVASLPTEGDPTLPRPYTIIRIDEVNPQNNSKSEVTFATQEEADRAARRH